MTVPVNRSPFVFHWLREDQGYEWVQGRASGQRLVARLDSAAHEGKVVLHAPLEDQHLFEKFAELKLTRASIQQFANRYGDLFNQYSLAMAVRRPPGPYRTSQILGSSLRKWKGEIQRVRTLVGVWKAVKAVRKRDLEGVIIWTGRDAVEYRLEWTKTLIASPHYNKHLLDRFKPLDVIKPAMYLVQAEINKRIADPSNSGYLAIMPRLVWCPGPRIDGATKPDHHQRIIFEPANLLAAMWLQFARAVTGGYQLRTCDGCGESFQVGKGARRAHTRTCSDKCRKHVSRENRKKLLRGDRH